MNPGTFTQIYIHLVFAVRNREAVIKSEFQEEVYKYMSGTINSMGHKALAINGMPDHIHVFLGLHPAMAISELVKELKRSSTNFINNNDWLPSKFQWQTGFGGYSYSRSQIDFVINYIKNQKEHHKKRTFREEYMKFLKDYEGSFTSHEIDIQKGDIIYMYSDGYADQFGGEKGKKFSNRRLHELLLEIHEKSMNEQKNILEQTITDWMNETEQIDDIAIMGIRL